MKKYELVALLAEYPDDMEIKFLQNSLVCSSDILEFTSENILHTSESVYINYDAPEDEWDCEDGKIELGTGEQYLLINPIIY